MSRGADFRGAVTSLWFRLITLAIVALVFSEALILVRGKAQGWTFYLTPPELAFEVVVRVIAAALAGIVLGSICAAVVAPLLWHFRSSRERLVEWVTKIAVFLVVFLASRYALEVLIKWSYSWSEHRAIYDKALLWGQFLAFAIALFIPRARSAVVTSLDDLLTDKMTRRTAVATVVGTAALVAIEFALGKRASSVVTSLDPQRPKSNFVLVTFDALAAEDMSLYGRSLPTTPNIDAFARKSTVFTKFFAASTFTTPCVAVIFTGNYPSESHVYGLKGRVSAENAEKSLPYLMRSAGYSTGAFLSNPWAYYLGNSFAKEFDVLPEPVFRTDGMSRVWDATRPLHQDSGVGRRSTNTSISKRYGTLWAEYHTVSSFQFRPVASFEHASQALAKLPDGFFLWVHLMSPHNPYLPDTGDRGRFLYDADSRSYAAESENGLEAALCT